MNYSDNAWSMISSKLLKTAVNTKVDHVKNSRLFDALNIDRWVYNTNKKVENYGPYAEDMKELFNVGTGSTLSTQDLDGVLYTVVKGLCQRVNDLEKQHNS